MTDAQIALARHLYDGKQHTVQQIADMFHVTKPTIYRHREAEQAGARL